MEPFELVTNWNFSTHFRTRLGFWWNDVENVVLFLISFFHLSGDSFVILAQNVIFSTFLFWYQFHWSKSNASIYLSISF